ncbi:MAG: translocation/assembly module TamB [Paramuribaculum sp.]|nr:translocation/assembly module TamB [Paramuribaculum sp.]
MKWLYKTVRSIIMVLLVLIFVVPAALYVALSMSGVQEAIRNTAGEELTKMLGVNVTIEHVSITPFNRVKLYGVKVDDAYGKQALEIKKLGAGISLWQFITQGQMELSYAEIIGLKARVYRMSPDSPLNIQPIIDALASDNPDKDVTKFDFRINTVVIRGGDLSYDVISEPQTDGKFSPDHIHVTALNADIQLPVIRNDEYDVKLRRFAFAEERSGFILDDFSGLFKVGETEAEIKDMEIKLPRTLVAFENIGLTYDSLKSISKDILTLPIQLSLSPESHITPSDLSAFVPELSSFDRPFDLKIDIDGVPAETVKVTASLSRSNDVELKVAGWIKNVTDVGKLTFGVSDLRADVRGTLLESYPMLELSEQLRCVMANSEQIKVRGKADGTLSNINVDMSMITTPASIASQLRLDIAGDDLGIDGVIDVDNLNLQQLLAGVVTTEYLPSDVNASVELAVTVSGKDLSGTVNVKTNDVVYRDKTYHDILLKVDKELDKYRAVLVSRNDGFDCIVSADALLAKANYKLDFNADISDVNVGRLLPGSKVGTVSGKADARVQGRDVDHPEGYVDISRVKISRNDGMQLKMDSLHLVCERTDDNVKITLNSDVAEGELQGRYHVSTLVPMCRNLIEQVMPVLSKGEQVDFATAFGHEHKLNDVVFDLKVKDLSLLEAFVNLPVRVIYPVDMTGSINSQRQKLDFVLAAPYLQQGDKLIEETSLTMSMEGKRDSLDSGNAQILFSTLVPTKEGMMKVTDRISATENIINNRLTFDIDRKRRFNGTLNMMASLHKDDAGKIIADIDVGQSRMVFNDTIWSISPSHISWSGKDLAVDGFRAGREGQSIAIAGKSSETPNDSITVMLDNVNLDYVFETLNIPNVTFGGNATGKLYAKQVLTPEPIAYTPRLNVERLKYNYSLLGDGIIESRWIAPSKAVKLKVTINQDNGRTTYVDGQIKPVADSLDLRFNADRVPVGFLQPIMSAFATEVGGEATGDVHLWGTFSLVQLVGELYGKDMKLKLGVNNTAYHFSDSIKFTPGLISFKNITIRDDFGHTALVNGRVTHKYLKDAGFDFHISDARDIMVYDFKEGDDRTWFGRVFADGDVWCHGEPDLVKVNVDMSTAPGTQFNLVLSDALSARNYDFITFRDRDQARKDSIAALTAPPVIVTELKNKMNNSTDNSSSVYEMNFSLEVTPQALITLVMDPVAGDKIRAYGHGNMLLGYNSRDDELRLNGTYTVERGTYNFTLQDIIIKEFSIENGSTIAFHGDAYAAQLDIKAAYALNANLTDLDESFAADKELNRTNVPVHAVLKVSGDMRRPEIGYDLNFPTLSQDIDRKVRSIVNTEEMMNRQIIYLLALNRFYTPDYMNSTNRSNELMSVASSTISSQLSSMLGQLSDKWAIAPNFRSDRGDFSDVEVNLALSSHLLNNRLLLNGNFGYRDKSLNNNSFIGDFDIEYLLNRTGSLRLKAYNRYNDQNYYVKSALTTQGVGVVFKHDFDNLFDWLFRKKKK